tara:strand:+ start:234 stop:425 length:192 start_codon:yes stop_codon:yes gene_type:complete
MTIMVLKNNPNQEVDLIKNIKKKKIGIVDLKVKNKVEVKKDLIQEKEDRDQEAKKDLLVLKKN